MHFAKKIKRALTAIGKYWKNRAFREKTLAEKRRLYLLDTKKRDPRAPFFSFFAKKKRFYYFNTVVALFEANKDRFRLSFLLIGCFLIFSSVYILFFSPYFRISPSKVVIERLDTITDINIAYKSIEDVYGESIFSINTAWVQAHLVDLQKNIKHIEVTRLFPNGLKIIVESYKPQFFVRLGEMEKNYIITSNGILVYQKESDKKIPTLDLVDSTLFEAGLLDYKEGVNEAFMRSILSIRDGFTTTFPSVNISKFVYFKAERELHIFLESGTRIIFRIGEDFDKQIGMLKFYNDSNKDIINSWTIDYIDVRILGKIFVCQDKTLCSKNLKRIYGDYYK